MNLCGKRGKNEFGNRIVNQILTLLDGMEDRGEVYLIGATNRIKSIDRALMRPGRFDKIIEVPLPKENERLEIFSKCIRNLPAEQFDFSLLNLDGFSSADISGILQILDKFAPLNPEKLLVEQMEKPCQRLLTVLWKLRPLKKSLLLMVKQQIR
ncbi:unnamed protein product [Medioppia subpectinata]|uniref:ATPase AAA-type core domain-containing protein n=1 Tax=Medioppia subpectinata TaxID=1979941 RepID=A0A7R9KCL5_9ACAR|nr:unnamed protein product [Medioppia subpectinata]CAG2100733.1 unnamed protein product [Medioppia subpectinata]